jgi:hypothetical protein
MVRPEIVTVAPLSTEKGERCTVSWFAPGPRMLTFRLRPGLRPAQLTVPVTLKVTLSLDWALVMA